MGRARRRSALATAFALVASVVALLPATATAHEGHGDHAADHADAPAPENSIAAAAQAAAEANGDVAAEGVTLPTGFADVEAIGDISEATSVAFAGDGTAFIALKTGQIKSFDYNIASGKFEPNATSTTFADLSVQVNNYWDRGLTGIALDPQFGTAGHNFVYVNYAYNHDPRNSEADVPRWGNPSSAYDECPAGQEASVGPPPITGCLATVRITRLTAVQGPDGWVMQAGSELPLLMGTCQQFGSHASGDVVFGPDGFLYASAGDGASFTTEDWGQANNPCPGDPANGVEGGSLRSQDFQTSGDPLGFGGSVVRMNPVNGNAPDGSTDMAKRTVAYGQRNPWRLTFRPGTTELWSGDVGAGTWEEINRVDVSTVTTPVNRGWPCYEGAHTGSVRQPGWDALNIAICENLYAQGTGVVVAPYFSYSTRGDVLTPGEDCLHETSANAGLAFGSTSSNYPGAYQGALFFADFARSCIWMLGKKANGDPDPAVIVPFVQAAETPVDLTTGPGGDLYYVDYGLDEDGVPTENAAGVHRIVYTGSNATPTARITASPTSGSAPLNVSFSGLTSTDPDGDTLTYAWDLDGDGQYDDSTSATPSRTYAVGTYDVGLQVNDGHGHTASTTQQIQAGNSAPALGTVTPSSSLTWSVGQSIAFSGSATDPQQGTMPASAFTWQLSIRHCPNNVCHTHGLQTFTGVSSGSFSAPDHEYPSHLLLTVTVTDSGGLTDSRTIQLDPKSVALTFASTPTGATVTVNGADHQTPHTETFIQGSQFNVTAAPTTTSGGHTHGFASWSDGGARTHSITAPATATTYTAAYNRPTAALTANPPSGSAPLSVTYTASATNAPGVSGAFSFAWDLDNDGQHDDGTGTTQSRTYNSAGSPVVSVRATDSRGATDTKSVTVNVNAPPVAAVTANPSSGNAPLTPTFDASGSTDPDGTALTYAWDLDDDGAFDDATGVTASRSYTGVGPHEVTVQVTDADNGTDTESIIVTVTNSGPTARITTTPSPATGNAPFPVSFSASTSSDPDGGSLTYAWDLDNDGAYDDGGQVTAARTYGVGNVMVRLRVTDDGGATSTASVPVTVANRMPVAVVSADPTAGPAPLAVGFSAVGSSDPDGTALTYAWDLDDDGAFDDATGPTANRSYSGVGPHRVTVQVKDADNGTATKSVTVTVTNTGPTARIVTNPASGTGPAPLTVAFDGSNSSDSDGGSLTYAWDLDGDGQYDDGTGPTAARTYQVGTVTVGLRVTDQQSTSATTTAAVAATNTAPTVNRVSTYPEGSWYVGQTLGFDASATDPQQDLPDSAYSFVMERQDCDSGCPRVVVQRWTGVSTERFVVPAMPYPSHLYLTATVTDDHGATGSRTVRVDPKPVSLTVQTKRQKLKVKVDGVKRRSGWTDTLVVGSTVRLVAPRSQVKKGVRYIFVRWTDGGARKHDVALWETPLTVLAVYRRAR